MFQLKHEFFFKKKTGKDNSILEGERFKFFSEWTYNIIK